MEPKIITNPVGLAVRYSPYIRITSERLPRNQLHVCEVEMDGIRIAGQIHDLPDFGRTA